MDLTSRQLAILNHVVKDGQAWADHATKEAHIIAKIAKYESAYDEAVAKGNYKTRQQRDDANAQAEIERQNNLPYNIKRQRAYPPMGDQLDALWKGGDDADAMKVLVNKVKTDFPKG